MYKVVKFFTDLKDGNRPYKVGDIFPRAGLQVSEERLKELSSPNNLQKTPLIQKIEGPKKVEEPEKVEVEEKEIEKPVKKKKK